MRQGVRVFRVLVLIAALWVPGTMAVAGAGTYEGHAYKWFSELLTWDDANATANQRGGHLVTIGSSGENSFVEQLTEGNDIWIGLNDKAVENTFVWVTGEPVNYTNWASGEPNNAGMNEDCAEQYSGSAEWNDLPCTDGFYLGYVVEWDSLSTVPTLGPTALAVLAGLVAIGGAVVVRRLRA